MSNKKQYKQLIFLSNMFIPQLQKFYVKCKKPKVITTDLLHWMVINRVNLLSKKIDYEQYDESNQKLRKELNSLGKKSLIVLILYDSQKKIQLLDTIYCDEAKYIVKNLKVDSVILENVPEKDLDNKINEIIKDIREGVE